MKERNILQYFSFALYSSLLSSPSNISGKISFVKGIPKGFEEPAGRKRTFCFIVINTNIYQRNTDRYFDLFLKQNGAFHLPASGSTAVVSWQR